MDQVDMFENDKPLRGVNVVDLGTIVMAPTVARLLGDYGATVIKLESHSRPDRLRTMTPYKDGVAGINRSGYFAMYNAGKLSLAVDLRKARGREFFHRHIAPWADVIIEAFMPGVAERLGIAYEDLYPINQELIMLRASLAGHTGPHRELKGTGQVTAALSGFYHLTGWADGLPVGPYSAYSDFVSWNYALVAILSALEYRRQTGKGQYIDQSLLESTLQFAAPAVLEHHINGVDPTRRGNEDLMLAPHGAYKCLGEDRWCVIAVASDEEWRLFGKAIGAASWTLDARFATLEGRKAHEQELDRLVEDWTSQRDPQSVMDTLQRAGIAAGVVQNAADLFEDPQIKHRQGFVTKEHPEIGLHSVFTSSFSISNASGVPSSGSPILGNDTEYVCTKLLGISAEELSDWIAEEVLD